jgi:SAM-dependent methyltransferase
MAEAGPATGPTFHDHFSGHAGVYRDFRPVYPAALYEAIAERSPATTAVWDCACGNGQASLGLAEKFDQVYATDASAQQIEQATPHPRISYSVAPAEASGLPDHSVDTVLVAQALHWFDFERFYAEVERVVRPGGLFVAVGYENAAVTPEVDAIVLHLTRDILGPYWPKESRFLHGRYSDIPRRFEPVEMPDLFMTTDWTLDQLVGYLSTWSSLQRYKAAEGKDPLPAIRADLAKVWGDPEASKRVAWHLVILAGRVGPRR